MVEKISQVKALKEYFKASSKELIDFRKTDPEGYSECAVLAAKEMGKEIG